MYLSRQVPPQKTEATFFQRLSVQTALRCSSNTTFLHFLLSPWLLPSWRGCCFLGHTRAFHISNWVTLGLPLFPSRTWLSKKWNLPPSSHCPSGRLGTRMKGQDGAHGTLPLKTPARPKYILRQRHLFSFPRQRHFLFF